MRTHLGGRDRRHVTAMSTLNVRLFGKLDVRRGDQLLAGLDARKTQELFAYLLLHRKDSHSREALGGLLWGESTTAQSMKYLRNALWQLRNALDSAAASDSGTIVLVDPEWISLNPEADLWFDVAEFESTFALVQGVPGETLDAQRAQALQVAAQLYRGDLLEGWYHDWCLYERLQNMYLAMLHKLMGCCEARQEYETGLLFGACILRYDRAREQTHRRLMRLHYLAGDRTAALRQYERCVAALREELGVSPAKSTVALYEEIRSDRLAAPSAEQVPASSGAAASRLHDALGRLKQLWSVLAEVQTRMEQDIEAVEGALNDDR